MSPTAWKKPCRWETGSRCWPGEGCSRSARPDELLRAPKNRRVAELMGCENLLLGRLSGSMVAIAGGPTLEVDAERGRPGGRRGDRRAWRGDTIWLLRRRGSGAPGRLPDPQPRGSRRPAPAAAQPLPGAGGGGRARSGSLDGQGAVRRAGWGRCSRRPSRRSRRVCSPFSSCPRNSRDWGCSLDRRSRSTSTRDGCASARRRLRCSAVFHEYPQRQTQRQVQSPTTVLVVVALPPAPRAKTKPTAHDSSQACMNTNRTSGELNPKGARGG